MAEPLLDIAGAAAYLGVSEAFIRRLVVERRVQYFKLGRFVRFRPADLDAFVARGKVEPAVRAIRNFTHLTHRRPPSSAPPPPNRPRPPPGR